MGLPFQIAVTRRRYGAFTIGTDGLSTRGTLVSSTIRGTGLQPMTGRELMTLPEGERTSEWMKFYTAADVRTLDQASALPADEIVVGSVVYEVRAVKAQSQTSLANKRIEVVRIREAG